MLIIFEKCWVENVLRESDKTCLCIFIQKEENMNKFEQLLCDSKKKKKLIP